MKRGIRLEVDDDLWRRFHHAAPRHIEQRFDLNAQTALLDDIYTETIARHERQSFVTGAELFVDGGTAHGDGRNARQKRDRTRWEGT